MQVRAIFYVRSCEITGTDDGRPIGTVNLTAAARGPYKHWAKWTPSGTLSIGTVNADAFAAFVERVGRDVALTITDPTPADLDDAPAAA